MGSGRNRCYQSITQTENISSDNEITLSPEIDSPPPQYNSVAFFKPTISEPAVQYNKNDDWMDELFGIPKAQAKDLAQLCVPTTELPDVTVDQPGLRIFA